MIDAIKLDFLLLSGVKTWGFFRVGDEGSG